MGSKVLGWSGLLVTGADSEKLIEFGRCVGVRFLKKVAIRVGRGAYARMTESLADHG
jgi:hypothetical protein